MTEGVLKIARCRPIWEVGVAGSPVIGRRRGGVLNITAAACTDVFHCWRSGNITRTKNVSEYMPIVNIVSLANTICRYNIAQLIINPRLTTLFQ